MFQIEFLDRAVDDLRKIGRPHQRIIKAKLLILAENPEALRNNIKKLSGEEGLYRLRVGGYRVIFKKDGRKLMILVVRIGHRKEIYLALE